MGTAIGGMGVLPADVPRTGAIDAAQQALAKANAAVAADRRAHSPGCVASDQKIADRATAQLAQATAAASAQLNITA